MKLNCNVLLNKRPVSSCNLYGKSESEMGEAMLLRGKQNAWDDKTSQTD